MNYSQNYESAPETLIKNGQQFLEFLKVLQLPQSNPVEQSLNWLIALQEFTQDIPNITLDECAEIKRTLLASSWCPKEYLRRTAYTNPIKRQYLASLKKLQTDLQGVMLPPFPTWNSGSLTKDTGVSTSHRSPSQSKKKTGQQLEPGLGKTLTKSPESVISPTMEELTGKLHTRSVQRKSTKPSKSLFQTLTGLFSKKTPTT